MKTRATLSKSAVLEHLAEFDAKPLPTAPPASPAQPSAARGKGGWSEEVKDDGHCHYFTAGPQVQGHADLFEISSLCSAYNGEALLIELDDVDPLAPENCKQCRTALLKQQGLIE